MRKLLIPLIALLVVAAILSYAMTFTVRFSETAVLTTFGSADAEDIRDEPGLNVKWPYPIQSVTKYDKRWRFIQNRSTTIQTADESQVIIEAFLVWRVDNALTFFQRFSNAGPRPEDHAEAASQQLRSILATAIGEASGFTMDELFSPDGQSRLPELEARILAAVEQGISRDDDDAAATNENGGSDSLYGIAVDLVGINRVLLPEQTTAKVIERMQNNRNRLADELREQGAALATAIRSQADADAAKIRAFAERLAAEIRAEGEREAAQFLAQQNTNPELAVFLANLEFMRDALAQRMTLVLSEDDFGFGLFGLSAVSQREPGEIPIDLPETLLGGGLIPGTPDAIATEGGQ